MIGEVNLWKILASRGYEVEGEMADIDERGTYHMSRVEGGTDINPPY